MNIFVSGKSSSEELKQKLLLLKPAIDESSKLSSDVDVPAPQRGHPFKDFQAQLQDGLHLVKKLEQLSSFNVYRRYRYGKQILKIEKNVNDFLLTQGLANLILDVHKLNVDFKNCSERSERVVEMGRHKIESVNAKFTSDATFNSFMLQQISTIQLFHSSIDGLHDTTMGEQSTSICNSQIPGIPSFVVGLNTHVDDVKQILLQNEVNVVAVEGMGGSGKTTLALALCNDLQVKGKNNLLELVISPVRGRPGVKAGGKPPSCKQKPAA